MRCHSQFCIPPINILWYMVVFQSNIFLNYRILIDHLISIINWNWAKNLAITRLLPNESGLKYIYFVFYTQVCTRIICHVLRSHQSYAETRRLNISALFENLGYCCHRQLFGEVWTSWKTSKSSLNLDLLIDSILDVCMSY